MGGRERVNEFQKHINNGKKWGKGEDKRFRKKNKKMGGGGRGGSFFK